MKKIGFILFLSIISCQLSIAQIGTWRNYLAYSEVQQIQAAGDDIFVMASNGLYQYNKQDQSIYTYDKTKGLSDVTITFIKWCQQAKRLVVVYDNSNIDLVETNGNVINISDIYVKSITGGKAIYGVTIKDQYAYLATEFGVVKLNVKNAVISESYILGFAVSAITFEDNNIYALKQDGTYLTANLSKNLIDPSNWTACDTAPSFEEDKTDYNTYIELVKTLQPEGPSHNLFGFMKFINGKLYTCDGDFNNSVPIQVLNNSEWEIYQSKGISDITGVSFQGAYCLDVDPNNENHVFAGARNGLYEYLDQKFVNFYNSNNSVIEAYNGRSFNNQLVTGVKFDKANNLWILNSQAPTTSLIKMSPDGTFSKFNHSELMKLNEGGFTNKSNGTLSNMMIDSQGIMWFVNNNHYLPAIYQYNMDTDQIKAYETIINQDGSKLNFTYYWRYVAEDLSHNIWVGTDKGPFMLERSQINSGGSTFTQVKVPRNDGTNLADYLLSGIDILSIAVDGAGRKWFGTNGNGVYLISSDNMKQVQHFTTENSKLLSDVIKSICINHTTGEVFFGTDKGLCSYISDATQPNTEMTKDNVWAYPNPVDPDYTGLISIVGLTLNADVKILSANGALIAEGKSNGGTFTWDGCDREGNRVSSGIYMVATSTNEGKKGTVCKIAIIR